MSIRLQKDIEKLKKLVVSLAALVEERFRSAMKSLQLRDSQLARKVVEGDIDIDHREVDIEEECLKILALHQPVADDLRFIVAVLKLNNDLERIGDLAVNIAERAEFVTSESPLEMPFDYVTMAQRAGEMLRQSLDSLVNMDLDLAYRVCAQDDEVDAMKRNIQAAFAQEVRKEEDDHVDALIHLFLISRHLERIADHATNIAEDVIYLITGAIHRHKGNQYHHS